MRRTTYILAFLFMVMLLTVGMTGCGSGVGINSGGGGAINCAGCGSTSGGGGAIGSNTSGALTVTMIDPPTCASPRGIANHIYLSVAGVQLNPDANATATSTGWVDVAPTLATSPKQIDMINPGTTLGNLITSMVTTGTYGSLKLLLASNSSTVINNQCGSNGVNCVISGATTLPIFVATETAQGIVVNSHDIPGATIPVVETGSNLNILFDSCSSMISYSGGFRLLPNVVAWGGGIQSYVVTLSDAVSQARLGAGTAIVALEQQDANGLDRIWAEATPDVSGVATIYGPQGTFDLVAVATGVSGGANTMYSPLAVTNVVGAGASVSVPMALIPQGVAEPGMITQSVASNTAIDARVTVQQRATINGVQSLPFTIPALNLPAATLATTTSLSTTCGSGACEQSDVAVPSQPIYVQTYGTSTPVLSSSPIAYTVFATPYLSQGAGVSNCTTPAFGTSVDTSGVTLAPIPGQTMIASTLTFAGCQ